MFHADSLCLETEKYSDKLITDIFLNPDSFLRKITVQEIFIPLFFFLIADLIKIDVSDNFVNLSEHFKQMSGDLSFEKRTQREFAVITVLWQVYAYPAFQTWLFACN